MDMEDLTLKDFGSRYRQESWTLDGPCNSWEIFMNTLWIDTLPHLFTTFPLVVRLDIWNTRVEKTT